MATVLLDNALRNLQRMKVELTAAQDAIRRQLDLSPRRRHELQKLGDRLLDVQDAIAAAHIQLDAIQESEAHNA